MSYDVAAARRLFPAVERMTYLDAGFQSPLSVPVKQRLEAFIASAFDTAGPKSEWLAGMETVRGRLAAFVNAAPEEIAFTKNTSEAMNIAANALPLEAGDEVLMLEGDHPNNAYAFLNLARKGVETRFLPMPEIVDGAFFERHLDARTRAISMSLVTFHAGHLFDVESVGRLCRERGLFFVVDVMQGIGVVPVDVKKIGATFVGSGTHKGLLLPQGLGFLYWNREAVDAQPSYMAAITLEHPPADLIARHDNMAVASTARRFEIGNFKMAWTDFSHVADFFPDPPRTSEALNRVLFDIGRLLRIRQEKLMRGLQKAGAGRLLLILDYLLGKGEAIRQPEAYFETIMKA